MKISEGQEQDGVVIGNTYDKYSTRNPIERRLVEGYISTLSAFVRMANPGSIHEVGCGEGYWVLRWVKAGYSVKGSDFSSQIIEIARENADRQGIPGDLFEERSIYELDPERDRADLVVCCEVLEHLEDPVKALHVLGSITGSHLILSVPNEPVWRVLNMVRGKYWSDWGNTPGHIQHWSRERFIRFVSMYFQVTEIRTPLPWIMLLCQPKSTQS
jgi:2-polyprenyl-3-methyl-5-hydroxy-6-metoxy-1,4-benzoquinol methylase